MDIKEFFDSYDFQDSNIKRIMNIEKDLLMEVERYNWRQPHYSRSEPETESKTIIFRNVKRVHIDSNNKEFDDGILEAYLFKLSRNEYKVRLIMENESIKTIEFITNDVEMM